MFIKDDLPKEYVKFLDKLAPDQRVLITQYYGLENQPALTLEQIAELRRAPDVNTTALKGELSRAVGVLRSAYEKYGW